MQSESVNGIPWEVNKPRILFNVWTQTGKAADRERERERERDESSLIIGALDSEVDTWTMEFHILNTNSTKHKPQFHDQVCGSEFTDRPSHVICKLHMLMRP